MNKTTFVCHRGTFRFPKMPFGLCNAPATFQRLMDTVLMNLNFEICLAYLNNIILFSHDLESHLERLQRLLDRLREANLKLKPSKCQLLQVKCNSWGSQSADRELAQTREKWKPSKTGPRHRTCDKAVHL